MLVLLFKLQNGHYKYLGQFTLMSITQGGCGIPFLAPSVYNYICTGKLPSCADTSLKDIPYPNLNYILEKVSSILDVILLFNSLPLMC